MKKSKKSTGTLADVLRRAVKGVVGIYSRQRARMKARAAWWAARREHAEATAENAYAEMEHNRGLIFGRMVYGPGVAKWQPGTHHYVARISRGQLTRRMRRLNGPLVNA